MIQLTAKINHRVSGLVILLCLAIVVAIFGYYWFFIASQTVPEGQLLQKTNNQSVTARATRSQFFDVAQTMKRYGAWPIINVSLSADRGNPFAPK